MYRHRLFRVKSILGLLFLVIFIILSAKVILFTRKFIHDTGLTPSTVIKLIFDTGASLPLSEGRTNILILGIGGGTHEGADLTDTMLIVSLKLKPPGMALVSLPRDIWSETLADKINSAYHYGQEKSLPAGRQGGGMVLAKTIAEDVTGMPMHYAVVIDFSGFRKVIDLVGGVTINVTAPFVDPDFPIAGRENDLCNGDPLYRCRYQRVEFVAGQQIMDGERALIYARSRHAEGEEGTDFARARRQQDIFVALKQKMVVPSFWFSPKRDIALLRALDDATDTDLTLGEFLTIGRIISRIKPEAIHKISIESFLVSPPMTVYGGRYVLVPKEDFSSIHDYIRNQLAQ